MNEARRKTFRIPEILTTVLILVFIFWLAPIIVRKIKTFALFAMCRSNLRDLGIAMQKYTDDYDGLYPTPQKWCDLLVEHTSINKEKFVCHEAGVDDGLFMTDTPIDEANFPAEVDFRFEHNDVEGQHLYAYSVQWNYFAMNPNAKSNSPPDMVLLFETSHGWNQYGGPELASVKNHLQSLGYQGCNVLFNDGSVRFIRPKNLKKLKFIE